jgi:hypothetical protein
MTPGGTLKMEAIRSSETSVLIRATRRHLPEDDNHHLRNTYSSKYIKGKSFIFRTLRFYVQNIRVVTLSTMNHMKRWLRIKMLELDRTLRVNNYSHYGFCFLEDQHKLKK